MGYWLTSVGRAAKEEKPFTVLKAMLVAAIATGLNLYLGVGSPLELARALAVTVLSYFLIWGASILAKGIVCIPVSLDAERRAEVDGLKLRLEINPLEEARITDVEAKVAKLGDHSKEILAYILRQGRVSRIDSKVFGMPGLNDVNQLIYADLVELIVDAGEGRTGGSANYVVKPELLKAVTAILIRQHLL